MDLFSMMFGGETSSNFKEIVKLHEMLDKDGIPHTFVPYMGGYVLRYFGKNGFSKENGIGIAEGVICSAIETRCSYGHEKDLIEIEGLIKDNEKTNYGVLGYLTADDVYQRIVEHYKNI